jgi:hypothetical protein
MIITRLEPGEEFDADLYATIRFRPLMAKVQEWLLADCPDEIRAALKALEVTDGK